jgi:hypothetical protein
MSVKFTVEQGNNQILNFELSPEKKKRVAWRNFLKTAGLFPDFSFSYVNFPFYHFCNNIEKSVKICV